MDVENIEQLQTYLNDIQKDLSKTVSFWLENSHDTEHGGFFNCLSEKGDVYDTTKYGWLHGRQVWTYCKLYNSGGIFQTPQVLEAATQGAKFLMKYIKDPITWKCYFQVTREGMPIKMQRTIFTECFYVMAMTGMAIATGKQEYKEEAHAMMSKIEHWVRVDDTVLGRPKLSGAEPCNTLAVPMMLLCLVDQMISMEENLAKDFDELERWCLDQILVHSQRDGHVVLENVTLDGQEMKGCQGRLTNPGHAIECGWFLLQSAIKRKDDKLKQIAINNFIITPLEYGWDERYGGIFALLDADGHPPTQLEWNMKLWWAHNEAMIALLMAYKETKQTLLLEKFDMVFNYSYKNFVDHVNGEWYGYLNQAGEVNMSFKGGPFKGCFHVIRCLRMCEQMLKELLQ